MGIRNPHASKGDLDAYSFRLLPIELMSRIFPTVESVFHCLVVIAWPVYVSGRHLASLKVDRESEIKVVMKATQST